VVTDDEEYIPRNREKAKTASYGFFWCDVCDYYYGGELGKCPVCGTKGNYKKIKYDRKRSSFNP
jgi:rubrerythrin